MLAHSKTTQHNRFTRHVLKSHHNATPEFHNHTMRNAFISLQQKKSLEDLFQRLDNSIAGKPTVVKRKTVKTKIEDKNEQQVSSSTRIPRIHHTIQRKRPSLEIPADLSPSCLKRRRSLKGRKSVSFQITSPRKGDDTQTFQKGDKVKIVQGAKKKFLGLTGQIEKYLFQKCKWGIALDNGSRIALGPECLKVLGPEDTLNTPAAPLRRAKTTAAREEPKNVPAPKLMRIHTTVGALAPPMQGRSLAPRGSTSLALPFIPDMNSIVPATEEQIAEFVAGFPQECRPKNVRQIMIAACVTGRKNIVVSLIVNSKIDVNVDFATAGLLHVTIMNDQPEVCLLLMEMGIEVDHQDSKGCTPLILAAQRGLRSVVAALCLAGADVNQTNNRKQTPLMVAAMHGHLGIVDILLENEADVQLQDDMAQNALTKAMTSADAPHRQVVDRLISRMYEIHSKEQNTSTGIKKQ